MALQRCFECGNEVSSLAARCPHCGVSFIISLKPLPAEPPPLPASKHQARANRSFFLLAIRGLGIVSLVAAIVFLARLVSNSADDSGQPSQPPVVARPASTPEPEILKVSPPSQTSEAQIPVAIPTTKPRVDLRKLGRQPAQTVQKLLGKPQSVLPITYGPLMPGEFRDYPSGSANPLTVTFHRGKVVSFFCVFDQEEIRSEPELLALLGIPREELQKVIEDRFQTKWVERVGKQRLQIVAVSPRASGGWAQVNVEFL